MSKDVNTLWVERYRPKNIEEMILTEEQTKAFSSYISSGEIPQLLLVGSPGSGKTTVARILSDSLIDDRSDLMVFNGSSVTGVDFIRDSMQEFMRTPIFGNSKHKICFIDEADYLSGNAFAAIRGISEQYSDNCRIIMTANYKYKIPDPILSRVKTFEFKQMEKNDILHHCANILETENIKYNINFLKKTILLYYPDIRRIVNSLQGLVNDGEIIADTRALTSVDNDLFNFAIDIINNKDVTKNIENIKNILSHNDVDLKILYSKIYETANLLPTSLVVLNRYINEHDSAMIPGLHFMSCLYEIKVVNERYQDSVKDDFQNYTEDIDSII